MQKGRKTETREVPVPGDLLNKQQSEGPSWYEKHHYALDFWIKIAGVLAAVATLIFFYFQLDGLERQNQAVWYSNRPTLRLLPIAPRNDIRPLEGTVQTPAGLSPNAMGYSQLTIKLENTGISAARLDSISYELVVAHQRIDSAFYKPFAISPSDVLAEKPKIVLLNDQRNLMRIRVSYGWDRPDPPSAEFTLEQHLLFESHPYGWSVEYLATNDYADLMAELLKQ